MAAGLVGVALPLAAASLSRTGVSPSLLSFPFSSVLGPFDAAALLVLVGLPHLVGNDVWAKLLSARDARVARQAALGAALSKLVFGASTATIALAGVGLGIAGPAPELFPRTVVALVGPALAPFLLVALVATMQSSGDSVLLSASAATVNDVLPPRFATPAWSRLFVAVWGAAGLLVALVLRDLLETFRLGYTLFASGLILPTLAAFVPGLRVPRAAAGTAMLLGGGAALAERFLRPTGLDPVLVGTGVNALVLAAGLAVRKASR
jgi:SSS family solute:Na+ symporter